ncbi:stage II sporulation protein M [Stratiformator vulcanicus]|uniref:Stage II sporulation protein M n=1 Tax=Stratiformator vulcanicus TaxID=2527980 RepID=A0A517QXI6_9PLAN|nr:stage II sporulation protein M [Stratiformator vulcanicus]QDT36307.1 hypothetical protein Pan189_06630 [Stratiformator vulcanicus]
MTKQDFIKRRREHWDQFSDLLESMDNVVARTRTAADVDNLSQGLREISADLAIIRAQDWDPALEAYLNDLAARGYNVFYSAPSGSIAKASRYLTVDFPRLFRSNIGYFVAASLLFFGPFVASWIAVAANVELAKKVLPPANLEQFDQMYGPAEQSDDASGEEEEELSFGGFGEERNLMFGFYVMNNAGIAIRCFLLGATFGIGTVYVLVFNGIVLGTVFGYVQAQGNGERLFSFAVSHGSFELTAIAVAGGAGLMIADAMIHPGNRSRLESLRVRGVAAMQIGLGAAAMLVVAALIEAYWSPLPIDPSIKYSIGGLLWITVALYLGLSGRGAARAPAEVRR